MIRWCRSASAGRASGGLRFHRIARELLGLAGFGAVAYGIWMYAPPIALIFAGCVVVGYAVTWNGSDSN